MGQPDLHIGILEIEIFTGRPVDLQEFWDGFNSAILENEERF